MYILIFTTSYECPMYILYNFSPEYSASYDKQNLSDINTFEKHFKIHHKILSFKFKENNGDYNIIKAQLTSDNTRLILLYENIHKETLLYIYNIHFTQLVRNFRVGCM